MFCIISSSNRFDLRINCYVVFLVNFKVCICYHLFCFELYIQINNIIVDIYLVVNTVFIDFISES